MVETENDFRLPTHQQRAAVFGRTGSGKTQFGFWLLSRAPFDRQPYVIVDYKRDDLLNESDRIRKIDFKTVPSEKGLYILHANPDDEIAMEDWLWKIWEHEKIGLFFDEAYMLPNSSPAQKGGAFQSILTQGRSKRIPAIVLTQRPKFVSPFVFTEADFFSVFHLQLTRDRQTVQSYMPEAADLERVPEYHSHWYDVTKNRLFRLAPVPDADMILETIEARLLPQRRMI
jgi:hypothetical protein